MKCEWLRGFLPELVAVVPDGCAIWRNDYDNWIGDDPDKRAKFGALPRFSIYACSRCGWVEEINDVAGVNECKRGHGNRLRRIGIRHRSLAGSVTSAPNSGRDYCAATLKRY